MTRWEGSSATRARSVLFTHICCQPSVNGPHSPPKKESFIYHLETIYAHQIFPALFTDGWIGA